MRVGENITIYTGTQPQTNGAVENREKEQEERKTLFAGELNPGNTLQDRIAQRREQAQKQAMKVVGEAWAGRQEIDEGLDESREHIKQLKQEAKELQEEASGVNERLEELEKAYEAGEISQEEYLSEKANLQQEATTYQSKLSENRGEQMGEEAVIRGTKRELLKDQSMVKAQKEADQVLEAAADEIIGMAVEASRDHIDEESEKREEQAEKIREEEEKKEELQEKRKEREEELEELLEEMPVKEMVSLDQLQEDIRQEVQGIVDKMKLLADDLKGAVVDQAL
ncbi:MAG: hypothetical protein NC541_01955 [bacterium]|nr:hypothetical protein [bacterium]